MKKLELKDDENIIGFTPKSVTGILSILAHRLRGFFFLFLTDKDLSMRLRVLFYMSI